MTARPPRLLVISPLRDEIAHTERLVRSVASQMRLPDLWIAADDGSRDGTAAALRDAVARCPFLRVLDVPDHPGRLDNEQRLARAAEARAFNWALAQIDVADFDFVAKLDGDIELPPDYYARALAAFECEPALGIAGGRFAELGRSGWRVVREPATHVPGALKVYRRDCLQTLGGLREHLGWDTVDETQARMLGFTTRAVPELVGRHHRPMGSVRSRVRGRVRYGACAYGAGYPWAWVVLRSLKVAMLKPWAISGFAFIYGYANAARCWPPSSRDEEIRRFVRAELRDRLTQRLAEVRARSAR